MNYEKIAVIDVETPNRHNNIICSIGIVIIEYGLIIDRIEYLINPETIFDDFNISIHGITENDVINSPKFYEIWEKIKSYFSEYLIVGHNLSFDLSCIKSSLNKYGIKSLPCYYIDTLTIARDYITEIKSHKLISLCDYLDVNLEKHHNALYDSLATAKILIKMCQYYDINFDDYICRYDFDKSKDKRLCVSSPKKTNFKDTTRYLQELQGILLGITSDDELNDKEIYALKGWIDKHKELKGNFPFDKIHISIEKVLEDNIITSDERESLLELFYKIINPINKYDEDKIDLLGTCICLTGNFNNMTKEEFSVMLENKGAVIKKSVVKSLNYLIVGGLGSDLWIHENYGSKVKKATEYNEKGANIKIIGEDEFMILIKS